VALGERVHFVWTALPCRHRAAQFAPLGVSRLLGAAAVRGFYFFWKAWRFEPAANRPCHKRLWRIDGGLNVLSLVDYCWLVATAVGVWRP